MVPIVNVIGSNDWTGWERRRREEARKDRGRRGRYRMMIIWKDRGDRLGQEEGEGRRGESGTAA